MRAHVLVAASFVLAAACDEGQPYDIGTSEPIQSTAASDMLNA